MRLVVVASPHSGDATTMLLSKSSNRETVEQEIRDGLIQDTFVELEIEHDGTNVAVFLNARHTLSLAVSEVPLDV